MKICFVSIDIESDFAKSEDFKGVENLNKIFNILDKLDIKTTLFVTGKVLEKYKREFKKLSKKYEIACHGFSHKFLNELSEKDKAAELKKFMRLYKDNFGAKPSGFRAPSHIISCKDLKLLEQNGFLYDSSIVPDYPIFKKYAGFKGKAPQKPYFPSDKNCRKEGGNEFLEIPVTGIFSVPIAGTWILKAPLFLYKFLFWISNPSFLTFSLHSWDSLNKNTLKKAEEILKILKSKNYEFLNGVKIYELFSKNRK